MRPKSITQTGTGTTNWIPLDTKQAPFNVAVGCEIVSGTATYTVEHTFQNVLDPTAQTPVAFPNSGLTAKTVSADGNYAAPVCAVRLNVTAGAAPVVRMTLIQGLR